MIFLVVVLGTLFSVLDNSQCSAFPMLVARESGHVGEKRVNTVFSKKFFELRLKYARCFVSGWLITAVIVQCASQAQS